MITGRTLDAYTRRGQQLLARCSVQTGNPEPGAAAFADWLAEIRPGLRTASWLAYRAASCHVLEGHPDPDAPAAIAAIRALGAPEGPRPPRRTSARRAKAVSRQDLVALITKIHRSRSMHAPALADWVVAGILTGLRPSEWAGSNLSGKIIRSTCVKYSEGWRGLSAVRELDLTTLARADFEVVRRMVNRAEWWVAEGDYAKHQQACGDLLRGVNVKLWPDRLRRITLYSLRHQFAANGKGGDMTELAAAMGHLAERSAFRSYGRAADGWGSKAPPRPGVSAAAVARVRRNGPVPRQPVSPSA